MPAAKQSSKSRLIKRAHLLRPQIVSVVVAGGQHVGADHDAPAHFLAETRRARVLVHVDDVAAGNAQPVAHAVIAREIGRRLRRRDDVVSRQRIFGVRQRNLDCLGAGILEPLRRRAATAFRSRRPCPASGIPSGMPMRLPLTDAPTAFS